MADAIVLLNMGGAKSEADAKTFLVNMFLDRHIVRINFAPFRFILALIISQIRAKKFYNRCMEVGGSPIFDITRSLADKLSAISGAKVFISMRYSKPFAKDVIAEIKESDIDRVVLIPLYPQYSTTTTLSSLEDFYQQAKKAKLNIPILAVERFYNFKAYNETVIDEIKRALAGKNAGEFSLIFSAHSLPQTIIDAGDPYKNECEAHIKELARLLSAANINFADLRLAYQSKMNAMKWLEPSLENALCDLFQIGIKKALILPLSFTIDNLETVYDLSLYYADRAKKIGFIDYQVCKCPNAASASAFNELYKEIIAQNSI